MIYFGQTLFAVSPENGEKELILRDPDLDQLRERFRKARRRRPRGGRELSRKHWTVRTGGVKPEGAGWQEKAVEFVAT
jgi:hypothetical protein